MRNKSVRIVLLIGVLVLVGWMIKGTFSQPGIGDLKGGFKEITHYRNENNTGPVQYVFIVTLKKPIDREMETFGDFQPHHKGGNTKVYYFLEDQPYPLEAFAGKVNFDPKYNKACIALYEKSAMGNTSLIKKPLVN
jgi:hypothetical protein